MAAAEARPTAAISGSAAAAASAASAASKSAATPAVGTERLVWDSLKSRAGLSH